MDLTFSSSPDVLAIWSRVGFSAFTVIAIVGLALILSSYIKIVTVLGIVRVGLGVSSLPSAFITVGLALVLSFFVMFPTILSSSGAMDRVLNLQAGNVNTRTRVMAVNAGLEEWRKFLVLHAHKDEKQRFASIAKQMQANASNRKGAVAAEEETVGVGQDNREEEQLNRWQIVAPAFFISELKEAFAAGLRIFLPFLVIDLLVANILVAVGLTQVNPVLVGLPFKLLLFVMVDGWGIIAGNLVQTYAL